MKNSALDKFSIALYGFTFFQFLYSACRFDLPQALDGGATLDQTSERTGLSQYSAQLLLDGCKQIGLVEESHSLYRNTELSALIDRTQSPNIVSTLEFYHRVIYPSMHSLSDSLAAESNLGLTHVWGDYPTLYDYLASDTTHRILFYDWMADLSDQSWKMPETLSLFHRHVHGVNTLVDCGGGNGTTAKILTSEFQQIKVTVFDRNSPKNQNLGARVFFHEGDIFKSPPPEGDAWLFSYILNIFSPEQSQQLLRRAYTHLPTGGKVLIFNSVKDESHNDNPSIAAISAYFLCLASGQGRIYSASEIISWIKSAGFSNAEVDHLSQAGKAIFSATK